MKFTPIFLRRFEEELEELLDFINEKYKKKYVQQFIIGRRTKKDIFC